MIRKSIFISIGLLLLYELFLRVTNIRWDTSQNDKSANIISVQNFLYNYSAAEMEKDTVLIGTSVSRKLNTDSIGTHFISLAFNAWNTYDGLELVKRSGEKPACLLVETNYAKSQYLEPEITSNLEPISYYSGKFFKSLQLQYQPAGLLIGWGKNLMRKRIELMKLQKRSDTALYQFNLQMNKEKMNEPIPDSVLVRRFTILKSLISGFKKENIDVIFFEVPVSKELQFTASMTEVRKYYLTYFPENEYRHIPLPAENDYSFSDGVHLSPQSAIAYSLYLKKALYDLKNN
jgi:hypothetical protein